jgi:S-adenosylmethionine hydrolase
VDVADLGPVVDPSTLTPGLVPLPREDDNGGITGEVLWVDHFGNCQLNVAPEDLRDRGVEPNGYVSVQIGAAEQRARWVDTFADAKPSELVLIVDSYGMCALAYDRRSAAAQLNVRAGSVVSMTTPQQ